MRFHWNKPELWVQIVLIFILFCLADHRVVYKHTNPTGDEPHYLVIAHSLAYDWDIKVDNNYRDGDWKPFFKLGELPPHYAVGSHVYSVHNFGLPLLIAFPYWLGGYPLVLWFMSALMALSLYFCWRTAEGICGRKLGNYLPLWFMALATPILPFASQVYPEVAAILIVSICLYILLVKNKPAYLPVLLALLAFLPFLHLKFLVLSGLLSFIIFFRYREGLYRVVTVIWLFFIVGLIAWVNKLIFGVFSILGPYKGMSWQHYVNFGQTFQTYLLDPQYGLLFQAPIYLAVIYGCYALIRRVKLSESAIPIFLVIPFIGYFLFLSTQPLFLIGWATAGRFIVPIMPVLMILVILGMNVPMQKSGKVVTSLLGVMGLLMSWLLIRYPQARYMDIDIYLSKFIPYASQFIPHYWTYWSWDWAQPMPSMIRQAYLCTVLWCLLGIFCTGRLIRADKTLSRLPITWNWQQWLASFLSLL
jgi:hypothetical protein